jgi:hypothetical protein
MSEGQEMAQGPGQGISCGLVSVTGRAGLGGGEEGRLGALIGKCWNENLMTSASKFL